MMNKADELLRKAVGALHGVENYSLLRSQILDYLDTPKKPMTEEEIDVGFNPYRMRWLADDQYFVAGVRFAEKHHGIGGNDD